MGSREQWRTYLLILTDIFDTDKVIVANLSSYKEMTHDRNMEQIRNDQTCVLNKDRNYHKYWQVKSFIFYRHARMITVSEIENLTSDNSHFKSQWPLFIIDRVASGLSLSKQTPPKVKKAYENL